MKDNQLNSVSQVYAQAFFNSVIKSNQLEQIFNEVNMVLDSFLSNNHLKEFFKAPNISVKEKESVCQHIFASKVSDLLFNLIFILIRNRRIEHLEGVLLHFCTLKKKRENLLAGELISAYQLNDSEKSSLQMKVERELKKKVELTYMVDKKIIGGFIFKSAEELLDNSIKGRLEKFRNQLG